VSRKKICVQGLGFVGAAMAVAVASARSEQNQPLYDVVGVDLATREGRDRVESLSSGEFPFATTDQDLIDSAFKAHQAGNLTAVTDESVYSDADVIIVDTPLNISYNEDLPSFDLTAYSEAVRSLARCAKKGCLILIESTVPLLRESCLASSIWHQSQTFGVYMQPVAMQLRIPVRSFSPRSSM
jgi:UDP-N-acetyl-D-glucosamine dehydrogenase